jgi:hypothetical protein
MSARRALQRGMSTLVVASIVLVAVVLVVGFAHRGLLLEQRSSSNQYKAAQAFEAAEAGLDWAIAQLNDATPIGNDCRAGSDAAALSFRERYLEADAEGEWTPRTGGAPTRCARPAGGEWACRCPSPGAEAADAPPPGPAAATNASTSFSVQLWPAGRPGQLRLVASGCSGTVPCGSGAAGTSEAVARAQVLLARVPGLGSEPAAALTARSSVSIAGAAFQLHHASASSGGMTLHAGGAVDAPGLQLNSAPGAPAAASTWESDGQMAALTPEGFFASVFRMGRQAWKEQPAVRVIDCHAPCDAALARAATAPPAAQLLWLAGGLNLAAPLALGTAERPVLLVVDGPVELSAAFTLHGMVYATDPAWHDTGGAVLHGATVFENALDARGGTQVHHDSTTLRRLQRQTGTFARVPGSWRDF